MWVGDVLVGDTTSGVTGPFDRAGAYADVGTPPMEARFDELTVMAGAAYRPAADDAAASESTVGLGSIQRRCEPRNERDIVREPVGTAVSTWARQLLHVVGTQR